METIVNRYESPKIKIEKVSIGEDRLMYLFFKRLFDVVASSVALLVLAIPMLIVALAIRIDSKGPAIYKQERLGLDGVPFTIYKFRSMRVDAEANGPVWAQKNDDRVTRVGAFIRKTRIDELPQLINIILGQMSIVGPRPERPELYDKFDTYIDGFRQRMYVKPGLSGLAQISGGYDLKPEEKILHDIEYISKRSLWLDLKIIFRTVLIVFNHKGAR